MIAHETGVANTIDEGGSYLVEALTDRMEEAAYDYFRKIDELGGMVRGQGQLPPAGDRGRPYRHQREVDSGERGGGGEPVRPEGEEPIQTLHIDPAFERKQIVRLQAVRARRDGEAVEVSLAALRRRPPPIETDGAAARLRPRARQRGEIVEALQAVFGTYTETPPF